MRLSSLSLIAMLCALVACDDTNSPTEAGLRPIAALPGNVAVDQRINGRIDLPLPSPSLGRVAIRMAITNTGTEQLTGGVCADRVDARRFGLDTWYDVTVADQTCPMIALVIRPGDTATVTGSADLARLRAVAGGAGEAAFVRVRQVFRSPSGDLGVQSAAVPVIVP